MITPDWPLLLIALPAVFLTGLSKGGVGGGLAMLGTPMLALALSPLEAAAVMLPLLMIMDAIGLISYVKYADWRFVATILPFGALGIAVGWLTANQVDDNGIRIALGLIAIGFAINEIIRDVKTLPPNRPNRIKAGLAGTVAGFTSFVSHAGAPPFQAYAIPLRMEPMRYLGSSVVFFAAVNALKWPAYFSLGHLGFDTLRFSALLLPVGVIGVLAGIWAVKRLPHAYFYKITYAAMLVIGAKLIWDGLSGL